MTAYGITESEILDVLETGEVSEARAGKYRRRKILTSGYRRRGRYYPGMGGGRADLRITYDPRADAVYIYLTRKIHQPDTRELDEDIVLDFDADERLVGIEVLAASKRLDLKHLLLEAEVLGEANS